MNVIALGNIGFGGIDKESFREMLASADPSEELVIQIDSDGGSVFDGFAMHDDLAAYPGKTKAVIQSAAFSIAAFIPMACDEIEITPNGYLMIHNPMADTQAGDDEEHASRAELLAKLKESYAAAIAKRTKQSIETVKEWMRAEKYFSAQEALEIGLVDRILEARRDSAVASQNLKKLPHAVYASLSGGSKQPLKEKKEDTMSETKTNAASVGEIKAACPRASSDFVVKCLERSLPIAQVTAEYTEEQAKAMEELLEELGETKAKLKAMEDEAEAKAMEEEEKAKAAAEEEEETAKARAKRPGVQPVANVATGVAGKVSATQRWNEAVASLREGGMPKAKAVQEANRRHPGLRQQMVAEYNSAS